ncbi:MAG: LysR family transcriptional regulator [Alphaproteobacteria bacterium]|nr:LysR family transcriptional regulator [Alphaproteobacteria bacterium]
MSSTKNIFYVQDAQIICLTKELGTVAGIAKVLMIGEKSLNVYTKRIEERFRKSLFIRNRQKKTIELTADGMEMYPACKSILEMMGGLRDQGPVNPRDVQGEVKLTSTQTIIEYFHLPYLVDFVADHPKVIVNLNQFDDVYTISQSVNEFYFTTSVENDTDTFSYYPYHDFVQKMWASKGYIKKHGLLEKIEDLYRHHFLFQRGYITSKIMGTDKVKSALGECTQEARCFVISGSRIIDKSCELGLGIMVGSEETIKLSGLNLERVLHNYESDAVKIYVKAQKSFLEKDIGKLFLDWIFECRDKTFSRIDMKPLYSYSPLLVAKTQRS